MFIDVETVGGATDRDVALPGDLMHPRSRAHSVNRRGVLVDGLENALKQSAVRAIARLLRDRVDLHARIAEDVLVLLGEPGVAHEP